MQILFPANWEHYELIDCGNFEKLERFGKYVLRRPEPKAVWAKSMTETEWQKISDTTFTTGAGFNKSGKEDSGTWTGKKLPDRWTVQYGYKGLNMKLNVALTSFKHVGIFPEQAPNWNYIYDSVKLSDISKPRILNLFAYTGAASLAAKSAGADVIHLDSVRQVVGWARKNMESSGMEGIRWVVEDALRFAKREVRRGNRYSGIILDPPAYGHGVDGEKWKLDENILEMMNLCRNLLLPEKSFLLLNLYSNGFSAIVADTLVSSIFTDYREKTFGELVLCDRFGKKLPLSVFSRLRL
ncbi:MAG: class I SAM-dependent methyltransferase [Prevotellaceae bacterium]|jgi:23S rRNA (cytosine1962-C5)-methyltransferase|nr:class I SAM-dependent methyltransferase [Prevotellaceae bacterium]